MKEFLFPDVGEGITEAELVSWEVSAGDHVDEDDTVASVETDKAVVEIPSPYTGTIQSLEYEVGDTVKVDTTLLTIQEDGDNDDAQSTSETEPPTETPHAPQHSQQQTSEEQKEEPQKTTRTHKGIKAMPRVKHHARQKGVDLKDIEGTGPHGRILLSDLEGHSGEKPRQKPVQREPKTKPKTTEQPRRSRDSTEYQPENLSWRGPPSQRGQQQNKNEQQNPHNETHSEETRVEELSNTRQAIASKMRESLDTAAQATVTEEADVTDLWNHHREVKDAYDDLTVLSYFVKASTLALNNHAELNARYAEKLELYNAKHIGIAVDADHGLFVPVVRDADQKQIKTIGTDIKTLANKVRNKEITRNEMSGATFTISSLGSIGGETFTPIINTPETGILGVGRIKKRPRYIEGEIQPRNTVKLSLTFDHRVVDGAEAARFLQTLKTYLEEPQRILIET
jgi:pyruvate dehydrogenase E2 component (dihydrolipoamide acetyltransferase)